MSDEISTTDLYQASYFHAIGLEFLRTDIDSSRKGRSPQHHFVFSSEGENLQELKAGWFNGKGTVSAQEYASSIKLLKQLVHT